MQTTKFSSNLNLSNKFEKHKRFIVIIIFMTVLSRLKLLAGMGVRLGWVLNTFDSFQTIVSLEFGVVILIFSITLRFRPYVLVHCMQIPLLCRSFEAVFAGEFSVSEMWFI